MMVCKWPTVKDYVWESDFHTLLRVIGAQRGGVLAFAFHVTVKGPRAGFLGYTFVILIAIVAN